MEFSGTSTLSYYRVEVFELVQISIVFDHNMGMPRFELGLRTPKARVLDQAGLHPRINFNSFGGFIKIVNYFLASSVDAAVSSAGLASAPSLASVPSLTAASSLAFSASAASASSCLWTAS